MAESNSPNLVRVVVEVSGTALESTSTSAAPRAELGADSPAWNPDSHSLGALFFGAHQTDNDAARRAELQGLYKALIDPTNDYGNLRKFQRLLGSFTPKTVGTVAPFDMESVPGEVVGETVEKRLNRYVGSVLPAAKAEASLTHSQYVLFWHILRDQEDLKLVSPFDPATLPW